MTLFGSALRLHGASGNYPYACWRVSRAIQWDEFEAIVYDRKK